MAGTVAVAVSQLAKERNSPRKVPSRLGIDHCSQKLQLFDVTDLLVLLVILTPGHRLTCAGQPSFNKIETVRK